MGGSSYSRPVRSASAGKSFSSQSQSQYSRITNAHKDVLPGSDRRLGTDAKNPIVVALDGTGSMGDSAKIMFDKMPMFWGQIEQKGYLTDPALSFAIVGDQYCDEAPLQITPFEKGLPIDDWLKKLWLEGGGGGQTMESYDLAAQFYLDRCDLDEPEQAFFFFIGDEDYYRTLDDQPTEPIFKALMEKFEVFFIHWRYDFGSTDKRIVKSWKDLMGERLIVLKEDKAIVDVMLGIISMMTGVRNLDSYAKEMEERGQSNERIDTVTEAIKDFDKKSETKVKTEEML